MLLIVLSFYLVDVQSYTKQLHLLHLLKFLLYKISPIENQTFSNSALGIRFLRLRQDKPQTQLCGIRNTYNISGKVSDTAGKPIKGIVAETESSGKRSLTDEQGNYIYSGEEFVPCKITFIFTDTDGPANGGKFEGKVVEVTLTDEDKVGEGSGWNGGEYTKTVDVVMNEVTPE